MFGCFAGSLCVIFAFLCDFTTAWVVCRLFVFEKKNQQVDSKIRFLLRFLFFSDGKCNANLFWFYLDYVDTKFVG